MMPLQVRPEAESGTQRTIPFDYALTFPLTGQSQRILRRTITVSVESAFIAVGVGYGFVPELDRLVFGAAPGPILLAAAPGLVDLSGLFGPVVNGFRQALAGLSLERRPDVAEDDVFANGFRLNPAVADAVLANGASGFVRPDVASRLFEAAIPTPQQIQFLYAIVDEGSGREFQSEPILSTAGLGTADGDRPFRQFAQPIRFEPRTTIRIEVTEVSAFRGQLHIALHGYKALGEAGTPTGRLLRGVRRRRS
jgi:hypothetical protein